MVVSLLAAVNASALIVPAPYNPNRIMILPRQGVEEREIDALHQLTGCQVLRSFPRQGGLQILEIPSGASVPEMVQRYSDSGLVVFAEADHRVTAAATLPDDWWFQQGRLWGLNDEADPSADIDATLAWDIARSSTNTIVAVIDSGIRYSHEDLAENLWTNPADGTYGFNALDGSHDPWDDTGHGTHVAGIIGARGNNHLGVTGVAWEARIMACKFLNANSGDNSDAVTCIDFARSHGARVINLSWGGSDLSLALSNAIWAAQAEGIIFVAAAGNAGQDNDRAIRPFYPASLELDNLISVGASKKADRLPFPIPPVTGEKWGLSNYGATSVDLFAPGADIYSTWSNGTPDPREDNTYAGESGTSMATAYVTGAVALLRARMPDAPYQEIIERLFAAVDVRDDFRGICVTGGRLNLRKMLDQATVVVEEPAQPVSVRVSGYPGHPYTLMGSTNLQSWLPIQTGTTDGSGTWLFLDSDSTNLPARFYEAVPAP